jgi:sacsin
MYSVTLIDAKYAQRFVLDTTSYLERPVLVDGLSDFQGPALLAYNDAIFSEKDFASLTSLGDSTKLQDKAATGKFGLGFSSVRFDFYS